MIAGVRILAALLFVVGLVPLLGCDAGAGDGSDAGSASDNRVEIPAAPDVDSGLQFVMPEWTVPAGEELMWCWVSEWIPEQDVMVTGFQGFQAELGGHHLVALGTSVPFEANYAYDCTDLDSMNALEPLVLPDPGQQSHLPDGYAVRVPAGNQIVIQSHYVNYTDSDLLVADVVHLYFAPEGQDVVEASYVILNHGALELEEGAVDAQVGCVMPDDQEQYNVTSMFGHMHELGTSLRIDVDQGEGAERLYEIEEWDVDFRDVPPITHWEPTAPLILEAGDRLDLGCSFTNTTGRVVHFPEEMCTAVALYYPASPDGLVLCSEED